MGEDSGLNEGAFIERDRAEDAFLRNRDDSDCLSLDEPGIGSDGFVRSGSAATLEPIVRCDKETRTLRDLRNEGEDGETGGEEGESDAGSSVNSSLFRSISITLSVDLTF